MHPFVCLTLAGIVSTAGLYPANVYAAPTRPHILLLTVDDMNWDSVGVYGSPVENPTPNIDRLANVSTRFTYGFVQVAVCTPSRHVMLSGSYSHSTKTEGFTDITPIAPTFPSILQASGYYTAIINKGVSKYGWDFQADRLETNQGRDPDIYARLVRESYATATAQGKPLFLMANAMDPHRPFHDSAEQMQWDEIAKIIPKLKKASRIYTPAEVKVPDFLPDLPPVRQEMSEYYSSVRRADDVVGAVLGTLAELGISDEVLIVFLSDHGISMPFAKANVYRESLRVPFMIKLPGQKPAGRVDHQNLVSAVDLAPTLLEILDLPVPAKMQGRSFKKLLQPSATASSANWEYVYGYYYQDTNPGRTPMFTVQDKRFGYIANLFYGTGKRVETSDYGNGATWQAMQNAVGTDPAIQQRVTFYRNRALEELYDYEKDPHALNNLIDDPAYAPVVARLTARLESWMAATECDALEAFRHRHDLAARKTYVAAEDEESFDRGGGKSARPVRYESESFSGRSASWSPDGSQGVFPVQPTDGKTDMVEVGARRAIHGLKRNIKQDGVFIYFHVHDGFTKTDQQSYPLKVRVTVYDQTPGTVQMQFNSLQSSYADTRPQKLVGDGTWKTLEFALERARFDNSQHLGADLRVTGKGGAELYLQKIEIERGF
jgi:N-sulfoglucosamine sulfohydrolase